jgi:AraC-like DNA-binding protein
MSLSNIIYKAIKPETKLQNLVESFWMLENSSNDFIDIVVLPDGRFDIFFFYSLHESYHVSLMGLGSKPVATTIQPKTVLFAISFRLLAIEYLLDTIISDLANQASPLPSDFLGIKIDDLNDFETFCENVSDKMMSKIKIEIDNRKLKLFELIYATNGSSTVKELSEKVFWSSRQINRYFNQHFGLSLKAYCNILRFRASFQHIKEDKLFPEQNFSDQAHFIKEVKKWVGVNPKKLAQNQNDRFIQFSTLPKK